MPYITVEAFEGRTLDQRRELARAITEAVARIYKTAPGGVHIIFRDMKKEDLSQAGVLYCDK
jgi:4-oxalocrotonate tautomerase